MSCQNMGSLHRPGSSDLQPFVFDELPEKEDGFSLGGDSQDGGLEEDEYDACNEETFGVPDPIVDKNDLAALAEKAELLNFDDDDEAPISWPDPSQIPIPTNFSGGLFEMDNIWSFNQSKPSTSKQDTSDDFFSFITNAALPQSFNSEFDRRSQVGNDARDTASVAPPYQINDNQRQPAATPLNQQVSQEVTNRNVLDLLAKAQNFQQQPHGVAARPPSPQKPTEPTLPGFGGPLPGVMYPQQHFSSQMTPMPPVMSMPPPQQRPGLPPNMPMPPNLPPQFAAMPPMMQNAYLQQYAAFAQSQGVLLPGMMPPRLWGPGGPVTPQQMFRGQPYANQYQQQPQQQHHYRQRLMSKKEREWLIKIQLIQCMGTGDPWDDDYYYALWKERNVLAKAPEEWKVKIKPKYYSFDDTYPADRYVPPVFNGSLGRPTHVSTSLPRQIIDLHSGNADDEESTTGKVNNQKKLRAVLMRIENASLALLECKDTLYKQQKLAEVEARDPEVENAVHDKLDGLVSSMASPEQLPTVMLIQKGRQFITQLISQVDDSQKCEILNAMVKTLGVYTRKIPNDSNQQTMSRAVVSALTYMDPAIYKPFRDNFAISTFEPYLCISVFAQQLCLSFLVGLVGREMSPGELMSGAVSDWLSSDSPERARLVFNVLNLEAVDSDLLNLFGGLSQFPQNSIAYQLSEVLKVRIKQRP